MTDLETTLAELARLRSGSEPIVSLYLDVRWDDEQQRDRVRLYVQEAVRNALGHYPEGAPGRDALERTLGRAREWVAGLTSQAIEAERQGAALFACEALGLWRPLPFSRPFENALATDAIPHLKQLARLGENARPVLVVAPDREGVDLFAVRHGEVELEETVRAEEPGHPRGDRGRFEPGATRLVANEGPTSRYERQDKDARHDENVTRRHRKAAAAELTALLDRRRDGFVVLVGPARTLAAFERDLPERVQRRIVARVPRPRGWRSGDGVRRDAVVAAATEGAREAARARAGRGVDALVGEALRGGVAVVGPEDVVLATNEGRVHALVLEEDFRRAGWRCDNCEALGAKAGSAETCPYCGGDLRVVRDLGEALVARTVAVGGAVEVLPHDRRLHGYRGIGAFLRQTAPTGLRGASPPWPTATGASQP
jgi:peptide subunit release factor 1 (eRF1)